LTFSEFISDFEWARIVQVIKRYQTPNTFSPNEILSYKLVYYFVLIALALCFAACFLFYVSH